MIRWAASNTLPPIHSHPGEIHSGAEKYSGSFPGAPVNYQDEEGVLVSAKPHVSDVAMVAAASDRPEHRCCAPRANEAVDAFNWKRDACLLPEGMCASSLHSNDMHTHVERWRAKDDVGTVYTWHLCLLLVGERLHSAPRLSISGEHK
jgi:hypothetical protein